MPRPSVFVVTLLVLTVCQFARADDAGDVAVDYFRDVKPIFAERCFACHGALAQESELRLDTVALMLAGGDSGSAIDVDDPEASLLLERVSDTDESSRMPPEGEPLSVDEIELLRRWITAGAVAPEDEQPEVDPRDHWSFRPVVRPPVPDVDDAAWSQNPIDRFIAARHAAEGLVASEPAAKETLLRRVYLDLIGLPSSRDELHAFLADEAPDAYEQVVDDLLARPQYGERWGRHWMDIWRYSDWYGRRNVPDVMNSYPQIWRWRDWIVRSLNDDRGYDEMVRQMLAADELCPTEDENIVATGFLVRNWFKWNYNQWMKDNVEHVGKAFLGLTLNCCHCHDHKYDPISQEEYFAFRAFFEPLELRQDRVPGLPDPGKFKKYDYAESYGPIAAGMIRVFDERLDAETYMYERGDARMRIEGRGPVEPGVPAILGGRDFEVTPVNLPAEASNPGLKVFVQEEELAKCRQAIAVADAALAEARAVAQRDRESLLAAAELAHEMLVETRQTFAENRGEPVAGHYSLRLDASEGRRVLSNALDTLGEYNDTTTASFRLRIIDDALVNLQLSPNLAAGHTGGYIGFEAGKIRAYKPGSHDAVEVGSYDIAAGQDTFLVELGFTPSTDTFVLRVTNVADGAELVADFAAALNGWAPVGDPNQGIFLDAHTGTVAALDDIVFRTGDAETVRFDFEAPSYAPESDVTGIDGWTASSFSAAGAVSIVSSLAETPAEVRTAEQTLETARAKFDALAIRVEARDDVSAHARADLASVEARIAAEQIRFAGDEAAFAERAQVASQLERVAQVAKAEADVAAAAARLALSEAQGLDDTNEKRAETLGKARKALTDAESALTTAQDAVAEQSTEYTPLTPHYPRLSTGRRAALARWITSEENPLTARVAANHIWARHFGQPLVASVANFGRNGDAPTHPELLDWLAAELIDHDWSMKHLHRLIVTSRTYRQTSGRQAPGGQAMGRADTTATAVELDPDNRYLWRFNTLRMEAEVVRDSVLYVAGELDVTMGGQELDHTEGLTSKRRSMYFSSHGEKQMQMLELFDGANVGDCYRRTSSIVPQQALALVNNSLALGSSRVLAKRLYRDQVDAGDVADLDDRLITVGFEQVLSRTPSAAELDVSRRFLTQQAELFAGQSSEPVAEITQAEPDIAAPATVPSERAYENFIHALINHNDFVTIR